jgi:hypothetical protein
LLPDPGAQTQSGRSTRVHSGAEEFGRVLAQISVNLSKRNTGDYRGAADRSGGISPRDHEIDGSRRANSSPLQPGGTATLALAVGYGRH